MKRAHSKDICSDEVKSRKQRGASLVDSALLLSMVAFCAITLITDFGDLASAPYYTAAAALEGGGSDATNPRLGRPSTIMTNSSSSSSSSASSEKAEEEPGTERSSEQIADSDQGPG